jgi:hypothetical protein
VTTRGDGAGEGKSDAAAGAGDEEGVGHTSGVYPPRREARRGYLVM